MIQTVKKGRHDFKPNRLVINRRDKLEFSVMFWPSCRYDFQGDGDQLDWNKGGGWAYNIFSNHVTSNLWAWRYIPENDKIEFCHYVHDSRTVRKSEAIFAVNINQKVHGVLDASRSGKEFSLALEAPNLQPVESIFKVKDIPERSRMVWGWFGGENNSPGKFGGVAPHEMSYEYQIH